MVFSLIYGLFTDKQRKRAHMDITSNTLTIPGEPKSLLASTLKQQKVIVVHPPPCSQPPEPLPTQEINPSLSPPTHQLNMPDPLFVSETMTSFLPPTHQLTIPDPLSIDEIKPPLSTSTHQLQLSDPLSISEIEPSLSPPTYQPDVPELLSSKKATLDSTSGCEESMKPLKNGKYLEDKYYDKPPPWLQAFLGKQSEKMDQQIELQKQLLQEARENNKILKRLVEVLESGSSKK